MCVGGGGGGGGGAYIWRDLLAAKINILFKRKQETILKDTR